MRAIDYAFRQGWASLRRGGGSSLFAVVAIALAMSVLGGLLLVTWNVERLLARWTTSAEFSVYLRDDATSERRGRRPRVRLEGTGARPVPDRVRGAGLDRGRHRRQPVPRLDRGAHAGG